MNPSVYQSGLNKLSIESNSGYYNLFGHHEATIDHILSSNKTISTEMAFLNSINMETQINSYFATRVKSAFIRIEESLEDLNLNKSANQKVCSFFAQSYNTIFSQTVWNNLNFSKDLWFNLLNFSAGPIDLQDLPHVDYIPNFTGEYDSWVYEEIKEQVKEKEEALENNLDNLGLGKEGLEKEYTNQDLNSKDNELVKENEYKSKSSNLNDSDKFDKDLLKEAKEYLKYQTKEFDKSKDLNAKENSKSKEQIYNGKENEIDSNNSIKKSSHNCNHQKTVVPDYFLIENKITRELIFKKYVKNLKKVYTEVELESIKNIYYNFFFLYNKSPLQIASMDNNYQLKGQLTLALSEFNLTKNIQVLYQLLYSINKPNSDKKPEIGSRYVEFVIKMLIFYVQEIDSRYYLDLKQHKSIYFTFLKEGIEPHDSDLFSMSNGILDNESKVMNRITPDLTQSILDLQTSYISYQNDLNKHYNLLNRYNYEITLMDYDFPLNQTKLYYEGLKFVQMQSVKLMSYRFNVLRFLILYSNRKMLSVHLEQEDLYSIYYKSNDYYSYDTIETEIIKYKQKEKDMPSCNTNNLDNLDKSKDSILETKGKEKENKNNIEDLVKTLSHLNYNPKDVHYYVSMLEIMRDKFKLPLYVDLDLYFNQDLDSYSDIYEKLALEKLNILVKEHNVFATNERAVYYSFGRLYNVINLIRQIDMKANIAQTRENEERNMNVCYYNRDVQQAKVLSKYYSNSGKIRDNMNNNIKNIDNNNSTRENPGF